MNGGLFHPPPNKLMKQNQINVINQNRVYLEYKMYHVIIYLD